MYNFDKIINRRGTGSLKWDVEEHELPMWVADMDFQTAPEILEALKNSVEHGIFGYNILPNEWALSYQNWWSRRHHFYMEKDWLIFSTGVIPIISTAVRRFTEPAEKVVVQTPVYNMFFNSIYNNGRYILESQLVYDDGKYSIDFEDLEKKLSDPQTTMMILCNPHNPIGKIWDKETLGKIGQLCEKYSVLVVSDEIHCDLCEPGKEYTPFAAVSEACRNNSITCIAPTKAFGIPGIQTAAAVVPNPVLRHRLNRALNTDEVAEPNGFAVPAAVAAFNKGEAWLEELLIYIQNNKNRMESFFADELPQLSIVSKEATYLLWVDCSKITSDSEALADHIRKTTGLYITAGKEYGKCGNHFLRINTACPRAVLEEGMKRLKEGILSF